MTPWGGRKSGAARAAMGGVLIKGGRPLEDLGVLTALAFDKTGTPTKGKPKLTKVITLGKVDEDKLLRIAVSRGEHFNRDQYSKTMKVITKSTITCPKCGHQKEEEMPTDACQLFYQCENCGTVLKPKEEDCCVYCSYGSVKCPPVQEEKSCYS